MYSSKVIENNLDRATALLRARERLPRNWRLTPSSPEAIAEMKKHFKDLLDDRGNVTRKLTREESLWILAEWHLCKLDFEYYARNYVMIEDWEARISYFNPNRAQRIVLRQLARAEERGIALMFMFLKARQLGITTLFQVLLSHRAFFYRNVGAYTGSAQEIKSKLMVTKLEFIWNNLVWWLRPQRTEYRAGELLKYGKLNSSINVVWGNQKLGIGRGATPTIAHLSELASFEDAASLVDASLVKAMHENPFALLGLESTAEGSSGWWFDTWRLSMKMAARGLARYNPIFLPWFVGTDLYPTAADLRRRPIPDRWSPPEYIEKHAAAARAYMLNTPILLEEFGPDWQMPREQKWWYHLEYEEAREKRQIHLLLQELPANPDEAFQNANPTVFSVETMAECRQIAQASTPIGAYQLQGLAVPAIYQDETPVGDSLPLTCRRPDGDELERFDLAPLRVDGWPDHNPQNRIYIWEWPIAGEEYGVALDSAQGVGLDNSVVQVIKKASPWHPDEQVAEWASNTVLPHDLWMYVFAMAHLYSVRAGTDRFVWPRVVIEVNDRAGDAAQQEMIKRGWSNFHMRLDLTKGASRGGFARAQSSDIGWLTTKFNRPKIISAVRKGARDGSFIVRSPELVREMGTLQYNVDKLRIEAAPDSHDDRVMACGIMLTSWYDPEVYGNVPSAWRDERQFEAELARSPKYTGGTVIGGRARGWEEPIPDLTDSRGINYGTNVDQGGN